MNYLYVFIFIYTMNEKVYFSSTNYQTIFFHSEPVYFLYLYIYLMGYFIHNKVENIILSLNTRVIVLQQIGFTTFKHLSILY